MRADRGSLGLFFTTLTLFGCSLVESDYDTPIGSRAAEVASAEPSVAKPEPSSPSPPERPAPALTDLKVLGVEALTPPFDPSVHRYSVRATDPVGELSITASADRGFAIEVAGESVESGAPTVLPDARPDSEIEIEVSGGDDLFRKYTLVYLPYQFPQIDVTVHEPGASSDPIYAALRSARVYYIAKLDENGVPLFYKNELSDVSDFKKHPGGELSYSIDVGSSVWENVLLNSRFEEVDRVSTVGLVDTDHHDFHVRENGNFIVMAYESTRRDLSDFGGGSNAPVVDVIFQELSPEREVLFQWSSWDHTSYDDCIRSPVGADYSHMNSVFVDTDGNWLISARNYSQVLKVDRNTGEVIWRLGGKNNEFTFIDDPLGGFCGQHNAMRVDDGNLLLFDNGTLCWPKGSGRGKFTRAVEYELDEQRKMARLVWSYHRPGIFTGSAGGAQRLPNGNTFIGWGNSGDPTIATEVDRDGNIVFEFEARGPEAVARSYRTRRYPD